MSWKTRLDVLLRKREWVVVALQHDSQGLTVKVDDAAKGVSEYSMKWDSVEKIIAFKTDALIYDIIKLQLIASDTTLTINEHDEGWAGLLEALPTYLKGALSNQQIFDAVAQPPFATNLTTVYEK
jgi:hypothetical protein